MAQEHIEHVRRTAPMRLIGLGRENSFFEYNYLPVQTPNKNVSGKRLDIQLDQLSVYLKESLFQRKKQKHT